MRIHSKRSEWNLRSIGAAALIAATGLIGCANPTSSVSGAANDGQIIGGTDATGNEDFLKSIVSLYNVSEGSLCTASILSDSILVTAAHCVDGRPDDMRVIFGINLDSRDIVIRTVDGFKTSPLWPIRQNQELNTGDIAVVKFSGGLAPGYKPAELLSDAALLLNDQVTMLAGYGISNGVEHTGAGRLRFVETTIKNATYTESEVLTEQAKGKGACHGDSGGPAYVTIDGKQFLWGVTSRGVDDPNNDCSVSAAYTSIPYYAAWIKTAATALDSAGTPPSIILRVAGF